MLSGSSGAAGRGAKGSGTARCIVGRERRVTAQPGPPSWPRPDSLPLPGPLPSPRSAKRWKGRRRRARSGGADARRASSHLSRTPLAKGAGVVERSPARPLLSSVGMGRSRSRSSSRSKHTKSSKHNKKNRSRSRSRSREKERARKRSKSRESKRNRRRESRSRSRSNTAPSSRRDRDRDRDRASSPPDRIDIFGRTVSKRSSLDEKQKREEEEKKAEFERQRKM